MVRHFSTSRKWPHHCQCSQFLIIPSGELICSTSFPTVSSRGLEHFSRSGKRGRRKFEASIETLLPVRSDGGDVVGAPRRRCRSCVPPGEGRGRSGIWGRG